MALKLKFMRAAVSAAALMIATAGPAAHAAPLLFTVTGSYGTGSWLLDSDPTPNYYGGVGTNVGLIDGTGDYSNASTIWFFSNSEYGGVGSYSGDVIYSNSVASPHFSIGTFNLYGGSLSISAAPSGPAAPAPLAGAGLLSAFAALAALARTRLMGRKNQVA